MAEVQQIDGVTVVEFGPEYDSLDGPTLTRVQQLLLNLSHEAQIPWMVLDLSHTRFIGSGFLETVSRAWRRLNKRGGGIVLCGVQPFCAEVLSITRLDTLWPQYTALSDALAALREQGACGA